MKPFKIRYVKEYKQVSIILRKVIYFTIILLTIQCFKYSTLCYHMSYGYESKYIERQLCPWYLAKFKAPKNDKKSEFYKSGI